MYGKQKKIGHQCRNLMILLSQILREIKFGESRCSKTAAFAILEARNFANLHSLR